MSIPPISITSVEIKNSPHASFAACTKCTQVKCPAETACSTSTGTCLCKLANHQLFDNICYPALSEGASITQGVVSASTYTHHLVNVPVGYIAMVTLSSSITTLDLYMRFDRPSEGLLGWDERTITDGASLKLSAQNCEAYNRNIFFSVWNPSLSLSSSQSFSISVVLNPIPGDSCTTAWVQSEVMGKLQLSGTIYDDGKPQVQVLNIPFLHSCYQWTLVQIRSTAAGISVGLYHAVELNYYAIAAEGE